MLGRQPGNFDEPACFQRGDGSLIVVGSSCLFPAGGPLTKYGALFDPRPCFGGIRWSCMAGADPNLQARTSRRALVQTLEGSGEVVAEHNVELATFLDVPHKF